MLDHIFYLVLKVGKHNFLDYLDQKIYRLYTTIIVDV